MMNCHGVDGPCGALDCTYCHGDVDVPDDQELESKVQVRIVTARKARFCGRTNEIRPGDVVKTRSWFTYLDGGRRLNYEHTYQRLAKGPAWI